jgi:PadR family transcriptional regulator, phenolic acid-responsive transcriptional regulator
LSVTEYAVLGLLDSGSGGQSGYDLLKRIERSIGYMWAPAKSGLYGVLGRLGAAGLASSQTAKERGPTKELYSITRAGRSAFRAWLNDSSLDLVPPRNPFLLKVFFARRAAPAVAAELVAAYREHVARLLEEWEEQERAEPEATPVELIALRFALLRGRATLVWCDETLEILEEARA